jgi:hypothetical protein
MAVADVLNIPPNAPQNWLLAQLADAPQLFPRR